MGRLEVQDLSHSYGRTIRALQGLSLTLRPGVTGVVGVNGAGKTTFIRVVSGGLRPTSGHVRVAGHDLYKRRERASALRSVAWMPQAAAYPKGMSVVEFVAYLTWLRGHSFKEANDRARAALAGVRLEPVAVQKLGSLSGGMIRRMWLAQALAAQSELLLLDEPSTGLDPKQRAVMVDLIREQARRDGSIVVMSSHIVEDVIDLADHVVVLDRGRVLYDAGPPPNFDKDWLLSLLPDEEAQ